MMVDSQLREALRNGGLRELLANARMREALADREVRVALTSARVRASRWRTRSCSQVLANAQSPGGAG